LIGKGVAGSLNRMTHAMKVLAECSSDIEIPAFDKVNELVQMSAVVSIFKDNMV
jgi:hypothetical protein